MTNGKTPQDLTRLLAQEGSALRCLPGRASARMIQGIAEATGWRFLHLDLGAVDSKAEFLKAAGKALHFPDWAGRNWDAFEELVNDLSWLPPAKGYLLLIERSSGLANADPRTLRTALDILHDALAARKAHAPRVVALVRGAGRLAADLPTVKIEKQTGKGSDA